MSDGGNSSAASNRQWGGRVSMIGWVKTLAPYGLAICLVIAATLLTLALWPRNRHIPFAFFYFAIVFSTVYGNRWSAAFATLLGIVSVTYFSPQSSGQISWTSETPYTLLLTVLVGLTAVFSIEGLKVREARLREQELKLKEAQRIARLGHWDLSLGTGKLSWSENLYTMFGVSPREFGATYEAFLERVHPEDRAAMEEANRAVLAGETPLDFVHRIILPDGTTRTVHERGILTLDEARRPYCLVGTVLDITERWQAEQALRQSEAAHAHAAKTQAAILNALPAHVALLDADGVIVAVNERWRRFGAENVLQSENFCIGSNYLDLCETSAGAHATGANEVAEGLREVLDGTRASLKLNIPAILLRNGAGFE